MTETPKSNERLLGPAKLKALEEGFTLGVEEGKDEVEKSLDDYCQSAKLVEQTTAFFQAYLPPNQKSAFLPTSNFRFLRQVDRQEHFINSIPIVVALYQDQERYLSQNKDVLIAKLSRINPYYIVDNPEGKDGALILRAFHDNLHTANLHAKFNFSVAFLEYAIGHLASLLEEKKRSYIEDSALLSALTTLDSLSLYVSDNATRARAGKVARECEKSIRDFSDAEMRSSLSGLLKK
jgi:hypothetical protein